MINEETDLARKCGQKKWKEELTTQRQSDLRNIFLICPFRFRENDKFEFSRGHGFSSKSAKSVFRENISELRDFPNMEPKTWANSIILEK